MNEVILETQRLRLRELTMLDLDFVAAMLAHPEVMRFFPKTYDRDEAREWIERQLRRYAEHGHGHWLVEFRETGQSVGQVGLLRQEVDGVVEPEISYLIHRPYWRNGLATEAALGVRAHAFKTLGRDHVISLIRPINEPSKGVAGKLGMRLIGETVFRDVHHLIFRVDRGEVGPGPE